MRPRREAPNNVWHISPKMTAERCLGCSSCGRSRRKEVTMPDQVTRRFLREARMLCALISGLIGAVLTGCAATSSTGDAVELGRQVAGLRSDLQQLAAKVSQLKESEGRVKTEIPH